VERAVYQTGEGELRGCDIGPGDARRGHHLRYDLQIPYRKVQHILKISSACRWSRLRR